MQDLMYHNLKEITNEAISIKTKIDSAFYNSLQQNEDIKLNQKFTFIGRKSFLKSKLDSLKDNASNVESILDLINKWSYSSESNSSTNFDKKNQSKVTSITEDISNFFYNNYENENCMPENPNLASINQMSAHFYQKLNEFFLENKSDKQNYLSYFFSCLSQNLKQNFLENNFNLNLVEAPENKNLKKLESFFSCDDFSQYKHVRNLDSSYPAFINNSINDSNKFYYNGNKNTILSNNNKTNKTKNNCTSKHAQDCGFSGDAIKIMMGESSNNNEKEKLTSGKSDHIFPNNNEKRELIKSVQSNNFNNHNESSNDFKKDLVCNKHKITKNKISLIKVENDKSNGEKESALKNSNNAKSKFSFQVVQINKEVENEKEIIKSLSKNSSKPQIKYDILSFGFNNLFPFNIKKVQQQDNSNNDKKIKMFNTRQDCLNKRIKTRLHKYVLNTINKILKAETEEKNIVFKLPKNFISNLGFSHNIKLFKKTVQEVYSTKLNSQDQETFEHNKRIMTITNTSLFSTFKNKTFEQVYIEYLNSTDFTYDTNEIKKKEGKDYFNIFKKSAYVFLIYIQQNKDCKINPDVNLNFQLSKSLMDEHNFSFNNNKFKLLENVTTKGTKSEINKYDSINDPTVLPIINSSYDTKSIRSKISFGTQNYQGTNENDDESSCNSSVETLAKPEILDTTKVENLNGLELNLEHKECSEISNIDLSPA